MLPGVGTIDARGKIRNEINYIARIHTSMNAKSNVTSDKNRDKILKFINTQLNVIENRPDILQIKDENDRNREILDTLHQEITTTDANLLGVETGRTQNNQHDAKIISKVLDELGIKPISKFSFFKNELATAKINALKATIKNKGYGMITCRDTGAVETC